MLHIVAGHLDLMRPHEEVKMIVVEELLGDVFSEHGSRLAARGLAALAVHGIGPEKVLQKTRHAVGEAIDLLDIAEQHAILLEESAMEDENALLKQRGDGESLEAFGEELHDGTVVLRTHFSVETEHLVHLSIIPCRINHTGDSWLPRRTKKQSGFTSL